MVCELYISIKLFCVHLLRQTEQLDQRPKLEMEKSESGQHGGYREMKWGNRKVQKGGREPDHVGLVGFSRLWLLLWIQWESLYIFEEM